MVDLGQRVQQRDRNDEAKGWPEQRQSDAAQPPHGAGSIDLGRVEQVLGYAGKPGEEKQHVIPRVLPHGDRRNRAQREIGIAEPVDHTKAEPMEIEVEKAVTGQQE